MLYSVWHGKVLVDVAAASCLNSTKTLYSARKLFSICTASSSTRMMSEKVGPALLDKGKENRSHVVFLGSLFMRLIFILCASLKMPTSISFV